LREKNEKKLPPYFGEKFVEFDQLSLNE